MVRADGILKLGHVGGGISPTEGHTAIIAEWAVISHYKKSGQKQK